MLKLSTPTAISAKIYRFFTTIRKKTYFLFWIRLKSFRIISFIVKYFVRNKGLFI